MVISSPPTEPNVAQVCVHHMLLTSVLVCGPVRLSIIRCFSWSCAPLHVHAERTINTGNFFKSNKRGRRKGRESGV